MKLRAGLKRIAIRLAYAVALIVTLIGLLVAVENLRGQRAWRAYKQELEAKGEKLDPGTFARPPVPDDENFAATPLLQPYREWVRSPGGAHDSNAVTTVQNIFSGLETALTAKTAPSGWRVAKFRDLAAMQQAMRAKTNADFLAQSPDGPALQELQARPSGRPEEDLLFILNRNRDQVEEIRTASRRPHAVFGLRYGDGLDALLPQLAVLKRLTQGFSTKAVAELRAGHSAVAFEDTLVCLRLSHAAQDEPLLITALVEFALLEITVQPIWEGLARQEWSDAQLATLVTELGRFNLVADMAAAMRGDRVMSLATLDSWRQNRGKSAAESYDESGQVSESIPLSRWIPSGWFDFNKIAIARMYQDFALPPLDTSNATANVKLGRELSTAAEERFPRRFTLKTPYHIFAGMLWPAVEKMADKVAGTQTTLNLARSACALERFRLAEGKFPENLDALVPRFLPSIPRDAVNGEPLLYRRPTPERFTLYSVALNLKDDGGKVSVDKKGTPQIRDLEGDWVWQSAPAD